MICLEMSISAVWEIESVLTHQQRRQGLLTNLYVRSLHGVETAVEVKIDCKADSGCFRQSQTGSYRDSQLIPATIQ